MACEFARFYSMYSALTMERGPALPTVTNAVLQYSQYAYLIPGFLFLVGVFFHCKRDRDAVGFECAVSLAWLLALFWSLFTIWVWVLPRIAVSNGVG